MGASINYIRKGFNCLKCTIIAFIKVQIFLEGQKIIVKPWEIFSSFVVSSKYMNFRIGLWLKAKSCNPDTFSVIWIYKWILFLLEYDENSIWKAKYPFFLHIRNPGRWVGCLKYLLWMSPNNGVRLCIVRIFAFEFGLLGKLSNSDITWIDWDKYFLEKLLIAIYSE